MSDAFKYRITKDGRASFINHCDECVGTGRLGLGLHEEYQAQLALTQREIGFRYMRGHGLFGRDLSIVCEHKDAEGKAYIEYNFTYLDRLYDMYLKNGIKPFIELGFMPDALASGEQTIFYWKGNVTPPEDYGEWAKLVRAYIEHIRARYGDDEVARWPVEVWNEPNLPGFWKDADLNAYLKLYEVTSRAVKEAFPLMKVGGPAICGVANHNDWIRAFLDFCADKSLPVDFITRHIYLADEPTRKGHYLYHRLRDVSAVIGELRETRAIIDGYDEYRGLPLHVTEFNTSYSPICPVHDTNENAVVIAQMLEMFGDTCASYSYWTFGDVFEEAGVPFTPFHGGFGLVANGLITKPTFWTFAFFKRLRGECALRERNMLVTREGDGYRGVCWSLGRQGAEVSLSLPAEGRMALYTQTVDEECCNPLKAWHDLGQPAYPSDEQMELIRSCGRPQSRTTAVEAANGEAELTFKLGANAIVYFELKPARLQNDAGFDYGYYCAE